MNFYPALPAQHASAPLSRARTGLCLLLMLLIPTLVMARTVRVGGGYEYERDDDAEYHVFRLGVTWIF